MQLHDHQSTTQGTAPGEHQPGETPVGDHEHLHGSPKSWALVAVLVAAFVAGAFGLVFHVWPLFWVCLGITILSPLAGKIVGIMEDTVLDGDPSAQAGQEGRVAEDYGSAVHPGVEVGPTKAVTGHQPVTG
ncbi:MAG TPA: hypothetical protein VGI00_09580 [Streptosporangiaceae bacterium]|jgi:hypothetical protein